MESWSKTLSDSFRKSWGPTVTQVWIPRQMCHGCNGWIWGKFQFFQFLRDLFVNDEDEEEIDFKTLDIENLNENDESEINEKDKETVTLDDPITKETKAVPVVIIDWFIDWFMILKAIKNSKMVALGKYFC